MADWARIKFYYDSVPGASGSTLDATSTAPGSSVDNIHNMLETNCWMAADGSSPCHITCDAGAGYTMSADYLIVYGHNLGSAGASIVLQYSSDNFTADINDAFTAEAVATDTVLLKEFTSPGPFRYWRLRLTGQSVAPYMAVCIWGNKTELDYASSGFDPHAQNVRANVNLSGGGYVAGVHTEYVERALSLRFNDADPALYNKVRVWWETSGLKNFFVAWDIANNPSEVFLMRPDTRFNNPMKAGGLYRDITISLRGRKE